MGSFFSNLVTSALVFMMITLNQQFLSYSLLLCAHEYWSTKHLSLYFTLQVFWLHEFDPPLVVDGEAHLEWSCQCN